MKLRKGSMHIVLLSALILSMQTTTVSCSRNGSLEQAMKQADENRSQLEKALENIMPVILRNCTWRNG
ncbi:MAG: hypothetical protein K2M27_05760 [Muribaculaceae bacterium]|nr:hypothetical protein [Muribaculaceae bacterium]